MMETGLYTILILEDDPNDVILLKRALQKNNIRNPVQVLNDGVEGVRYLSGIEPYSDRSKVPFPSFIIMDLKMPRMGGLEVLEWLREHPQYRVIPTLVLSSSKLPVDILTAYKLGANSYMVKPGNFDDLQNLIRNVYDYWSLCTKPVPGEIPQSGSLPS
jgi:CheY-like chemotaxis protein